MTVAGFKIYYGDGSIVSSKGAVDLMDTWRQVPASNVCVVLIFFQETYTIWHEDHYDVENYKQILALTDYYAFDGQLGYAFDAPHVPPDLPDGAVKLGGLIEDGRFESLHQQANDDNVF